MTDLDAPVLRAHVISTTFGKLGESSGRRRASLVWLGWFFRTMPSRAPATNGGELRNSPPFRRVAIGTVSLVRHKAMMNQHLRTP